MRKSIASNGISGLRPNPEHTVCERKRQREPMGNELLATTLVPLWLKVAWTVMVLGIVLIYWRYRGQDRIGRLL